jgi:hypothetical protein
MPFHTPHSFNTKFKKDPAIERWVYQRYFGQFGQFKVNGYALKWLTIIYGVIPFGLYYFNEQGTVCLQLLNTLNKFEEMD